MPVEWQRSASNCLLNTITHAHTLAIFPTTATKSPAQCHNHNAHRMRIMGRPIAAIEKEAPQGNDTPPFEEGIRLAST